MRKLSTGEPCAGEPHARFGGRGESAITFLYPYMKPVLIFEQQGEHRNIIQNEFYQHFIKEAGL